MGHVSGIFGVVNNTNCVRTWSIGSKADLQAFVCSASRGAQGNIVGNTDWSGNYTAYGPKPAVMPGDAFAFEGAIDETDGGKGAKGTAIVDSIDVNVDIEGGGIINHTVNFSGNGPLTFPAFSPALKDLSIPLPYSSIGCKVELCEHDDWTWAELEQVRTYSLLIKTDNQAYVDSSTGGQNRRARGNMSLETKMTVYTDDFAGLPPVNDVLKARLYVNATDYWEIYYIIFSDASDLTVDREGASIVGASLSAKLAISTDTDEYGAPVLGHITQPDETTEWWPV